MEIIRAVEHEVAWISDLLPEEGLDRRRYDRMLFDVRKRLAAVRQMMVREGCVCVRVLRGVNSK